ncbi:host specificity factor TipJ family phage tail protein [Spongiibacter tropicus]|uniref:host specificity factor TipJ family phage tail protein n=1 Tax=Spongiibacter tropicus TaxID=454602 RepID=UPI0003B4FED7|nr:host specificity factor TipJ family phage tail protein [Spongiibacter tropicus]
MASIAIYDQLGDSLGSFRAPVGCTLAAWLAEQAPSYTDLPVPPYLAELNGQAWEYADHARRPLAEADHVVLTLRARDPVTLAVNYLIADTAYQVYRAINLDIPGYQSSTPEGASSYNLNVRANRARLNGIIPEIAGSFPRYPDLLTGIRRVYEDQKEVLYLAYPLGVGRYNTGLANVYVGETTAALYNDALTANFYGPGDDLGADEAAQNWVTSVEIGGSRSASGLELIYEAGAELICDLAETEIVVIGEGGLPVSSDFDAGEVIEISTGPDAVVGYYYITAKEVSSPYAMTVDRLLSASASDVDPDWQGFSPVGEVAYEDIALDIDRVPSVDAGPWSNWYSVGVDGRDTLAVEVDYRFPAGLLRVTGGGSDVAYTVKFEVQLDYDGAPSPESVLLEHTDKTRDALLYTWRDDFAGPRSGVRVRFRRHTRSHTSLRYTDNLEIVQVKARLPQANSYDDVSVMTLRMVGTNTLAASAENKINIRGDSRLLPTLANLKDHLENGTPLVYSATSSIARFVCWTLFDMLGDEALDAIDWARFGELETLWESRGDTLNGEFTDETTLWEALRLMLAPGFAEPLPREGRVTAVRKQSGTVDDIRHFYTPDVMLGEGVQWSESWYNDAEPDGIDIEIIDPDTGKAKVVECRLPGDLGGKPKRIQLIGVTDEVQAWRYGMRERRRLFYKPGSLSFDTELDGLNSLPGDFIAVASDLDLEQYGVVRGFDDVDVVTLDRVLEWSGAGPFFIAFRKDTGRMSDLFEVQAVSAQSRAVRLLAPSNLDFTFALDPSLEPTCYSFGTEDEWASLAVVTEISPTGFGDGKPRVSIVAEEYVAEIYADDNNLPPS